MWRAHKLRNFSPLLNFDHSHKYARFVNWPTQSGVAIYRKCCVPHGVKCGMFCTLELIKSKMIQMNFTKIAYAVERLAASSFDEHPNRDAAERMDCACVLFNLFNING